MNRNKAETLQQRQCCDAQGRNCHKQFALNFIFFISSVKIIFSLMYRWYTSCVRISKGKEVGKWRVHSQRRPFYIYHYHFLKRGSISITFVLDHFGRTTMLRCRGSKWAKNPKKRPSSDAGDVIWNDAWTWKCHPFLINEMNLERQILFFLKPCSVMLS